MDSAFNESINPSCSSDNCCETSIFECNICFDLAQDPIVTLCGHLYCWPCIYRWLHFNSYCHECPVCKALIQEEKLVPIYGRGKGSSDLRSRSPPGVDIPKRPAGQRPETAPAPNPNYFRQDEFGNMGGFVPMVVGRFGNLTRSALFGAIPNFFNFQMHGFHDATVYGTTTGIPYLFSTSIHGGYAYGFYQHTLQAHGAKSVVKICFLFLGLLVILLCLSSPYIDLLKHSWNSSYAL